MAENPAAPTPDEPDSSSGEPRFHFQDKRRIDPETGEVRRREAENSGAGDESIDHLDFEPPADLAGSAPDHAGQDADAALADAEKRAAELLDDLQRERASFTNYRNRALRDQEVARRSGKEEVLVALLPVLDDVDRARQHSELTGPFASIAEKLDGTLTKMGVERIGASGEPFDPAVHEALMHRTEAGVEVDTVDRVLEAGYRIGDHVVRAARVAVVGPEA